MSAAEFVNDACEEECSTAALKAASLAANLASGLPSVHRSADTRSGVGRDLGEHGIESYQETKQVTSYVADAPLGWYSLPKASPLSKL